MTNQPNYCGPSNDPTANLDVGPDSTITVRTAAGEIVTGVWQGAGGPATREQVERAIRQATKFRPLGIYEPTTGHALVREYPGDSDSPSAHVLLAGATVSP